MNREELESLFIAKGFTDFKWISPKEFVIAMWPRFKCMYGCPNFGKKACCPPQVPSLSECERFFKDYEQAVIFHFQNQFNAPADRHAWTANLHLKLVGIEREVFFSGCVKVFLITLDSCKQCNECTPLKEDCKQPKIMRPCPEALGIDVFSTVRKVGYPIEVLKNPTDVMNRYAFLLIE